MEHLEECFAVSGQSRSTQRYAAKAVDDAAALLADMAHLAGENRRRGCRYISRLSREGYSVPRKRRKKRAIGHDAIACDTRAATCKNDVWTWDFVHDRLVDGRVMKCLALMDEHTRECLALRVERSITGADLLDTLSQLFGERGAPGHLHSDNGPEFVASQVKECLKSMGVETLYIEAGAHWQNGYAESFNSRLRDEFLEMNYFNTMTQAKELAKRWKEHYNNKRLHSALGYKTPAEFARRCGASGSAPLRPAMPEVPQRGLTAIPQ